MTTTPLIDLFISIHREKFDSSDWQQRNWMRNELIEMNVPELEDYIDELRVDLFTDNLDEAKESGYEEHQSSTI
jgi:hypothetical protein